ncbi:MAG: tripartite tricarboxylate transporter substrate binding protein [Betaproteobacteria bacterium]|nr:tripartite tricarboxylate transporter substrate binding protein [Betaproteobacteria bacterium]NBT09546.1 tripartite tricarboxylate transporter substrate binding protein [Betaproteobacteria bacterium]NBU48643.1 tripartite tricarboxylate transporter substrate binding protein [Betaproteobacteria bacterium]NBX95705.1 tripartite tricarboxylate transporter substrate binding protein [Betaproteobacteria bacterium]
MQRRCLLSLSTLMASALAAPVLATAVAAHAQDLPKKTITMVVGFAPGGAADTAARIIGRKLADNTGLTVVIENKAGAGGNIAHQYTANGPTDGSVILFGSVGPLAIAPHLMKVGYDPVKDLAPITLGVNFPNVLVVHSGLKIKTFADFIDFARKNPGKLDFASTGAGSASHLAGELLDDMAKIDTVHIPYKGGAPALQDLLGGRVASYYSTLSTAKQHIESGKLIPLATTGTKRIPQLPHIPTIAESGFAGYVATNWYAFVASSKVPKPILDRWNTELVKVLNTPEVVAELNSHGMPAAPGTREELAKFIAAESALWGRVIRDRKISLE